MKIALQKSFISDIKNVVKFLTGNKNAVLQNILVDIQENHTSFTGSDMQTNITVKIPAGNDENIGKTFLIDGKEFLKKLEIFKKDRMFVMTYSNDVVTLTNGMVTTELKTDDSLKFPPLMECPCKMVDILGMEVGHFTRKLAMASEVYKSGHPIYESVCFRNDFGKLMILATDLHRLVKLPTEIPVDDDILPKNAMVPNEVCDMVSKQKTSIKFGFGHKVIETVDLKTNEKGSFIDLTHVKFEFGCTTIISRLYEGRFPDHERIFPKEFTRIIGFNRKTLLEKLSMVKKVNNMVVYDIGEKNGKLHDPDNGVKLDIDCGLNGEPVTFALSAKYVEDFLKHSEADIIVMKYSIAAYPVVIEDRDNNDYLVVMPMTK